MSCCDECFEDWITCTSAQKIVFNTTLVAGTYVWVITNDKGNSYAQEMVYDGIAEVSIDAAQLLKNLFTPDGGTIQIELHADTVDGELVEMQLCAPSDTAYTVIEYNCINLTVKNCNADLEKLTIGIPCTV